MSGHYEKGLALYRVDRFAEARAEFLLARSEDLQDAEPVVMVAWCDYSLKKYKDGLRQAKEAVGIDPDDVRALQVLGSCFLMIEDFKNSRKAFERALELDPDDAYSHYLYSWFLSSRGQVKKALVEIDLALSIDPENSSYMTERSRYLSILGRKQEAKEATRQALRLDPEDADSHVQQGVILRSNGDVAGAIKAFQEALRREPNNELAREELLETGRSRFILYRWLLNFSLLLGTVPPMGRWIIIAGPFYLVRILHKTAKTNPPVLYVAIAVGGVWLFCVCVWLFSAVFMDALALFDPVLRPALDKNQRVTAPFIAISLLIGILLLACGLMLSNDLLSASGGIILIVFLLVSYLYRLRGKPAA